jgi:hypothetical protein
MCLGQGRQGMNAEFGAEISWKESAHKNKEICVQTQMADFGFSDVEY